MKDATHPPTPSLLSFSADLHVGLEAPQPKGRQGEAGAVPDHKRRDDEVRGGSPSGGLDGGGVGEAVQTGAREGVRKRTFEQLHAVMQPAGLPCSLVEINQGFAKKGMVL